MGTGMGGGGERERERETAVHGDPKGDGERGRERERERDQLRAPRAALKLRSSRALAGRWACSLPQSHALRPPSPSSYSRTLFLILPAFQRATCRATRRSGDMGREHPPDGTKAGLPRGVGAEWGAERTLKQDHHRSGIKRHCSQDCSPPSTPNPPSFIHMRTVRRPRATSHDLNLHRPPCAQLEVPKDGSVRLIETTHRIHATTLINALSVVLLYC